MVALGDWAARMAEPSADAAAKVTAVLPPEAKSSWCDWEVAPTEVGLHWDNKYRLRGCGPPCFLRAFDRVYGILGDDMSETRRKFFAQIGLLSAGSAFGVPSVSVAASRRSTSSSGRPRHIIHLVADGMSSGTLTLADYFSWA